jgi:L-threonylcarbamoyladenylate synthase
MVRIITKDELKLDPNLLEKLRSSVFIYPTDTIYGIGCDATNESLVMRIRELKKRTGHPFSVIIPNKNLVYENCRVSPDVKAWMDKLPGSYTLIFRVEKPFFSRMVNPIDATIGVRIPNHWFSQVVKRLNVPVVSTSVNFSGEDFMTSIDDLNPEIKRKVDFIIYEGPLRGRPSTVVHLEKEEIQVMER